MENVIEKRSTSPFSHCEHLDFPQRNGKNTGRVLNDADPKNIKTE